MKTGCSRIESLDGLRGLASLGIALFWHYSHFTSTPPFKESLRFLYQHSQVFVDLFFVISGFVFAYVYQDIIRRNKITAKKFFLKRLARLYPLHLITLLFVVVGQLLYYQLTSSYFIYTDNNLQTFI